MPFDPTAVTRLYPPQQDHAGLRLQWESASPAGTYFQVYVARKLQGAWLGRSCVVPTPTTKSRIDVGAVGPGEQAVDFSASLPSAPLDRAVLAWKGGRWLGVDIAGFRAYQGTTPGGAVDYSRPVAELPLAVGDPLDGFGLGTFGGGGFGYSESSYSWTSDPLRSGVWSFAIVSFDAAGNEGAAVVAAVSVVAPPAPPARAADRLRLHYTYDPANKIVTLTWLESN